MNADMRKPTTYYTFQVNQQLWIDKPSYHSDFVGKSDSANFYSRVGRVVERSDSPKSFRTIKFENDAFGDGRSKGGI